MKHELTGRAAYEAYRARWQAVADKEAELLRATPFPVRMRQFQALFETARRENWQIADQDEDEQVRVRWKKLREYADSAR